MPHLQVPHSPFGLPPAHELQERRFSMLESTATDTGRAAGARWHPPDGLGVRHERSAMIRDELSKELAKERAARRFVERSIICLITAVPPCVLPAPSRFHRLQWPALS